MGEGRPVVGSSPLGLNRPLSIGLGVTVHHFGSWSMVETDCAMVFAVDVSQGRPIPAFPDPKFGRR